MAVQWQNRDLPLGQGVDDNSAKTALPPGKLKALQNCHFIHDGALTKRTGFSSKLGQTSLGGNAPTLLPNGSQLLAGANNKLWDYSAAADLFQAASTPLRSVPTRAQVVASPNASVVACDVYSIAGYTCKAWSSAVGQFTQSTTAQIIDEATGTVLATQTNVFDSTAYTGTGLINNAVQCIGLNAGAGVVYFLVTTGNLIRRCVITSGVAVWDTSAISTTFGPSTSVCVASRLFFSSALGNAIYYAGLYDVVGGGTIYLAELNNNLTTAWTASNAIPGVVTPIGGAFTATAAGSFIHVGYVHPTGNALHAGVFALSNGARQGSDVTVSSFTPAHVTVNANSTNGTYVYDDTRYVATPISYICQAVVNSGSTITTSETLILRSVSLASDFVNGYCAVVYYSLVAGLLPAVATGGTTDQTSQTINGALFVVDVNKHLCARVFRDSATAMAGVSSGSSTSTGVIFAATALSFAESDTISAALNLSGMGLVRFNTSLERNRGVPAQFTFNVAGGSPQFYDGVNLRELGFHVYPEIVATQLPTKTTGLFTITARANSTYYTDGTVFAGSVYTGGSVPAFTYARLYMVVSPGTTASNTTSQLPVQNGGTFLDGTAVLQDLGVAPPSIITSGQTYTKGTTAIPASAPTFQSLGLIYVVSTAGAGTSSGEPVSWPTTIGGTANGPSGDGYVYTAVAKWNILTGNKTVTYALCYAEVDAKGQIHRSPLSPTAALTITPTGSGNGLGENVLITGTMLRLTDRPNVRIEVYRTAGDGTTLKQIANIQNNPSVDYFGFVDIVNDTAQLEGAPVYQGQLGAGGLARTPAPSCSTVAVFENRVACNDLENPYSLVLSQIMQDGTGLSFADELRVKLNGAFGELTALMQMDDKLVIFQSGAVSILAGDGVDNTGTGVDWSMPVPVATDVGCTNPDSLVLTPLGIFFQSVRGMYLLGRNLTTTFIGEPISNTLSGTVLSAVNDPTVHQIMFLAQDSGGVTGVFVYDYTNDAWGEWLLNLNGVTATSLSAWNNAVTLGLSNGTVYQQAKNSYSDPGGTYALWVEIADIRFSEVNGFGRCRGANLQWLSSAGGAGITVDVFNDYNDLSTSSYTSLAQLILAAGQCSMGCRFANRRAESIALRIRETVIGTADLQLEGITFEIGVERGLKRLPSSKRTH